jgi:hypothetical protein
MTALPKGPWHAWRRAQSGKKCRGGGDDHVDVATILVLVVTMDGDGDLNVCGEL